MIWIPVVIIVISLQMAGHLLTMPIPKHLEQVAAAIFSDFKIDLASKPRIANGIAGIAYHFIYENCRCTKDLIKQLGERSPLEHVLEKIIFIGNDGDLHETFSRKGYLFAQINRESAERKFQIESAPLLAVLSPDGTHWYIGGYFPNYGNYHSADAKIIAESVLGKRAEALPLYGCAFSKRLEDKFYPIKWLRNSI
jgi:hypothetical protein